MSQDDGPIGVMHLIDSLAAGGAERMAVNLVNALPRARYRPFLASTREAGPLAAAIAADVEHVHLARRGRLDLGALRRLARYVQAHDIRLLHAHSSSLFLATIVRALIGRRARPAVLWHDHYGRHDTNPRPSWLYRWPARWANGVIAVNPKLAAWSRDGLGVDGERVWYLRNFVLPAAEETTTPTLPGDAGSRIVCVANFRRQKDHATLITAMARIAARHPAAHLLLIGTSGETRAAVVEQIDDLDLGPRVSVLGRRDDVPAVLRACDVGVLSSASEGLPLALLEYGQAGLPAVSTAVGECPEVLDHGAAGLLVAPGDPEALAMAVLRLLNDHDQRRALGDCLQRRVASVYGVAAAIARLEACYQIVLGDRDSI